MNIKALFFDIDGTLVSFTSHTVPASTVEALEEAHRRGVGIYISTGRPMAFITNLKPIAHLIDGYITTNGAYCVVGDTVVSSSRSSGRSCGRTLQKPDLHRARRRCRT